MPLGALATVIHRVTPDRVVVSSGRAATLTVAGSAFGVLACGGRRRWVWGAFTHTFSLPVPATTTLTLVGIGGVQRREVRLEPRAILTAPEVARRASPTLRVSAPSVFPRGALLCRPVAVQPFAGEVP